MFAIADQKPLAGDSNKYFLFLNIIYRVLIITLLFSILVVQIFILGRMPPTMAELRSSNDRPSTLSKIPLIRVHSGQIDVNGPVEVSGQVEVEGTVTCEH